MEVRSCQSVLISWCHGWRNTGTDSCTNVQNTPPEFPGGPLAQEEVDSCFAMCTQAAEDPREGEAADATPPRAESPRPGPPPLQRMDNDPTDHRIPAEQHVVSLCPEKTAPQSPTAPFLNRPHPPTGTDSHTNPPPPAPPPRSTSASHVLHPPGQNPHNSLNPRHPPVVIIRPRGMLKVWQPSRYSPVKASPHTPSPAYGPQYTFPHYTPLSMASPTARSVHVPLPPSSELPQHASHNTVSRVPVTRRPHGSNPVRAPPTNQSDSPPQADHFTADDNNNNNTSSTPLSLSLHPETQSMPRSDAVVLWRTARRDPQLYPLQPPLLLAPSMMTPNAIAHEDGGDSSDMGGGPRTTADKESGFEGSRPVGYRNPPPPPLGLPHATGIAHYRVTPQLYPLRTLSVAPPQFGGRHASQQQPVTGLRPGGLTVLRPLPPPPHHQHHLSQHHQNHRQQHQQHQRAASGVLWLQSGASPGPSSGGGGVGVMQSVLGGFYGGYGVGGGGRQQGRLRWQVGMQSPDSPQSPRQQASNGAQASPSVASTKGKTVATAAAVAVAAAPDAFSDERAHSGARLAARTLAGLGEQLSGNWVVVAQEAQDVFETGGTGGVMQHGGGGGSEGMASPGSVAGPMLVGPVAAEDVGNAPEQVEVMVLPSAERGGGGGRGGGGSRGRQQQGCGGGDDGMQEEPLMGVFDVKRYLEGRDCILVSPGYWMSRSQFEKKGGSKMAKWYRSIHVLPDKISLGEWLENNGIEIIKGPSRRTCKRSAASADVGAGTEQADSAEQEGSSAAGDTPIEGVGVAIAETALRSSSHRPVTRSEALLLMPTAKRRRRHDEDDVTPVAMIDDGFISEADPGGAMGGALHMPYMSVAQFAVQQQTATRLLAMQTRLSESAHHHRHLPPPRQQQNQKLEPLTAIWSRAQSVRSRVVGAPLSRAVTLAPDTHALRMYDSDLVLQSGTGDGTTDAYGSIEGGGGTHAMLYNTATRQDRMDSTPREYGRFAGHVRQLDSGRGTATATADAYGREFVTLRWLVEHSGPHVREETVGMFNDDDATQEAAAETMAGAVTPLLLSQTLLPHYSSKPHSEPPPPQSPSRQVAIRWSGPPSGTSPPPPPNDEGPRLIHRRRTGTLNCEPPSQHHEQPNPISQPEFNSLSREPPHRKRKGYQEPEQHPQLPSPPCGPQGGLILHPTTNRTVDVLPPYTLHLTRVVPPYALALHTLPGSALPPAPAPSSISFAARSVGGTYHDAGGGDGGGGGNTGGGAVAGNTSGNGGDATAGGGDDNWDDGDDYNDGGVNPAREQEPSLQDKRQKRPGGSSKAGKHLATEDALATWESRGHQQQEHRKGPIRQKKMISAEGAEIRYGAVTDSPAHRLEGEAAGGAEVGGIVGVAAAAPAAVADVQQQHWQQTQREQQKDVGDDVEEEGEEEEEKPQQHQRQCRQLQQQTWDQQQKQPQRLVGPEGGDQGAEEEEEEEEEEGAREPPLVAANYPQSHHHQQNQQQHQQLQPSQPHHELLQSPAPPAPPPAPQTWNEGVLDQITRLKTAPTYPSPDTHPPPPPATCLRLVPPSAAVVRIHLTGTPPHQHHHHHHHHHHPSQQQQHQQQPGQQHQQLLLLAAHPPTHPPDAQSSELQMMSPPPPPAVSLPSLHQSSKQQPGASSPSSSLSEDGDCNTNTPSAQGGDTAQGANEWVLTVREGAQGGGEEGEDCAGAEDTGRQQQRQQSKPSDHVEALQGGNEDVAVQDGDDGSAGNLPGEAQAGLREGKA
uniref:RlsC n=1 Tax=Volvox ferrisii TaxID=1075618 RepID=A0A075M2R6_9CHLO|nr:RlsC [Volvox ferrisii]